LSVSDVAVYDPAEGQNRQLLAVLPYLFAPRRKQVRRLLPRRCHQFSVLVAQFGTGRKQFQHAVDVLQAVNRDPSKEYCRFLAVFEASEDGSPANLKLCLGADGDTIGSETAEYYQH
jgi:hypothetical protein